MAQPRMVKGSRWSPFKLGFDTWGAGTKKSNFNNLPAGYLFEFFRVRVVLAVRSSAAAFTMAVGPQFQPTENGTEGNSNVDKIIDGLFSKIAMFVTGQAQSLQSMPPSGYRSNIMGNCDDDPVCIYNGAGMPYPDTIDIPAAAGPDTTMTVTIDVPIGLSRYFPWLGQFAQSSAVLGNGRFEAECTGASSIAVTGGTLTLTTVTLKAELMGEVAPPGLAEYAGPIATITRYTGQSQDNVVIANANWLAICANNGNGSSGQLTGPITVQDSGGKLASINYADVDTQALAALTYDQMIELGKHDQARWIVPRATKLVPIRHLQDIGEMDAESRSFSVKTNNATSITVLGLGFIPAPGSGNVAVRPPKSVAQSVDPVVTGKVIMSNPPAAAQPGPNRRALG